MGYAKIWIFQVNKKEQVLDNLVEKMDKCPAVELGVPSYPPKKREKKKMIAHGPSNKQYASKSWQVFNFQSLWSKSMAFISSPFWSDNKYNVRMLENFCKLKQPQWNIQKIMSDLRAPMRIKVC